MKKMKYTLQVIYENGTFRPLEPVPFFERQRLNVSISDEETADAGGPAPSIEQRWLQERGNQFADEWIALDGDRLVSHGPDAKSVFDEARAAGVPKPFFVRVTKQDDLPFGGW